MIKGMKNILFTTFCLIFFFSFIPSIVSAQTSPIPTPTIAKPTCGYATETGIAQMCCGNANATEDAKTAAENVGGLAGLGIGAALSVIDSGSGIAGDVMKPLNPPCYIGAPDDPTSPSCKCVLANAVAKPPRHMAEYCKKFFLEDRNPDERRRCIECAEQVNGVWTGLGCVPADMGNFISNFLLQIGISFAGMVAFFCIIYSAFILQTSQGNPEKIQAAREQLTSCITGLMMVILSIFILRVIGVDILKIPGLG